MSLSVELRGKNGNTKAASAGAEAILAVSGYEPGDRLVFDTGDEKFVKVKIHASVAEAILYVPSGEFYFDIPQGEALRGFAPGTFEGAQTVTVRAASREELAQYRNLCLNPLDFRLQSEVVDPDAPEWSNPTDSVAAANGEVAAFPHAYANRVTRNEGCFYARNAIDGVSTPGGHGDYPYHSWGGAVHEDLTLAVYFGREVEIDKVLLYLRSDYSINDEGKEHDTYWHTALIELSDGFKTEVNPVKSADGQTFELGKHRTSWLKLSRLDPLQHDGSQNFAALNQIEVMGKDVQNLINVS